MTMVPAASSKQNYLSDGYGGCYGSYSDMSRLQGGGGYDSSSSYYYYSEASAACLLGSDLVVMAEDESRTNSVNNTNEETGSSSKDIVQDHHHHHHQEEEEEEEERDHDHEGWLQLGIGGGQKFDDVDTTTFRGGRSGSSAGLVELDLLNQQQAVVRPLLAAAPIMTTPTFGLGHVVPEFRVPPRLPIPNYSTSTSTTSSLFLQQHHQQGPSYTTFPHHHHQEINWAFRPLPPPQYATTTTAAAVSSLSSSSSLLPQQLGSYFPRPYQLHTAATTGVDHVAGPSSDMRVINAPRRPHSGIWFMLQASQNQAKEPYLPQISKSYLRIKDGRMTVRLLMKYLVNKLRLDSESEIEITCRGQQLLPFLTLQHVRDNIWSSTSPRNAPPAFTLLPDSSTTDHVMVLRYGRTP